MKNIFKVFIVVLSLALISLCLTYLIKPALFDGWFGIAEEQPIEDTETPDTEQPDEETPGIDTETPGTDTETPGTDTEEPGEETPDIEISENMSAKNFTFDGNACTGWVGPSDIDEIVIPRSYSIASSETVTYYGANIIKDEIIPLLRKFLSVTFCKSDGSNPKTYTSVTELESAFKIDFPDNDVVIKNIKCINSTDLKRVLNYILVAPFIASKFESETRVIYNTVESFTNNILLFNYTAYFDGTVIDTIFIDGDDYKVTNVSNINNFSGFTNVKKVVLLDNIISIGDRAFYNCRNLTSLIIPDSVTSIGENTFEYCIGLTGDFVIPEGVTIIGDYAFAYCTSLTSVLIPESVAQIGNYAFLGCDSLKTIILKSTTPPIIDDINAIPTSITSIYVPSSAVDTYKAAENWSNFADKIVADTELSVGDTSGDLVEL